MEGSDIAKFGALVILLVLSAFFSSAETALTTVSRIRMRTLAQDGNKRAEKVLAITENTGKMLSAILIGNNLVNISASSIATTLAIDLLGSVGAGVATGVLTLLILIFGEISPKTMASIKAEQLALAFCRIIGFLMWILTPVIILMNALAHGFIRLCGVDISQNDNKMTEEELRTIVDVSQETGVIESEERKIIHNLFDFGDDEAKEIMVPRIDMSFVSVDSSFDELMEIYSKDLYTRYPVYEETTDNVVGIVNVKDLLLVEQCDKQQFTVRGIMRDPFFTYEHKNISELFLEMKKNAVNVAVVLDEYGATAGLITMEDLLEEIVGEIRDEYDYNEEEVYKKIDDLHYEVSGLMNLEDFSEMLDLGMESENSDTVGGYLLELLEHFPTEGECLTTEEGVHFEIAQMDKKRIAKVLVTLQPKEETEDTSLW